MMKKGTILIAAGLLLITAAIGLTGYNLWDDYRAGESAGMALDKLARLVNDDPIPKEGRAVDGVGPYSTLAELSDEIEYPDYVLNPKMDMISAELDGDGYVGILSIPAIDRELPVLDDWSYDKLKKAPCVYTGSVYQDDLIICAHNYKIHFGYLKNLSYGDTVTFTDMDGNVFTYQVTEIEILKPTMTEELASGDWDLTLFTCTVGGRTRVIVRCERVDG